MQPDFWQAALAAIVDNAFEVVLAFLGLVVGIVLQRLGERAVSPSRRGRVELDDN